jgi:hypothetical protein
MSRIKATEAEKKYNISRMTVGRWIKAGRIQADAANEVDEDELEALIQAKRKHANADQQRGGAPKVARGQSAGVEKEPKKPLDPDIVGATDGFGAPPRPPVGARSDLTQGDHLRPGSDLSIQDKTVSIQTKQVKLAREKIRYLADVKKLIPYDVVGRSYSMISSSLEEQFRMFDEREGEELFAVAKDATVIDFKRHLRQKIDHGIRSVCAVVEKQNAELKESKK